MKNRTSGNETWKKGLQMGALSRADSGEVVNRECKTHGMTPHRRKRKRTAEGFTWNGEECIACERDRGKDLNETVRLKRIRHAVEDHHARKTAEDYWG